MAVWPRKDSEMYGINSVHSAILSSLDVFPGEGCLSAFTFGKINASYIFCGFKQGKKIPKILGFASVICSTQIFMLVFKYIKVFLISYINL